MSCSSVNGEQKGEYFPFTRDTEVLGTWWWWVEPKDYNEYLDFARENGVNEIYFHTVTFNNGVGSLIERAHNRGIKFYLLIEEEKYLNDRNAFTGFMNEYAAFQKRMPEKRRFAGLHLDLEPQNHPQFGTNKQAFLQSYLDFIVWVCSTYRNSPGKNPLFGTIDLDIAWWFDYDMDYRGGKEKLYRALILEADRVFLMSYMDTAKEIYNISKEEIAFAKSRNKQIILGAETGRLQENPEYSFYGKSLTYFYEQLHKLHELMNYENYGLSIHYISSWYAMARQ